MDSQTSFDDASSVGTMGYEPLRSMEQLECHFTWRPLDESTKSNLEDVIKKTERKIERDPHWKVPHLCTLAYLHTLTTVKKFDKASELLQEALKADEEIQRDISDERSISSEFVIRANLLFLRRKNNRDQPLRDPEIADDMKKLNELWCDTKNRARVYGLKGATFNCFGPKKYPIGADAFAEASKLQPNNFDWLYGEALTRARCGRQTYQKPTEDHLLTLWRKAREIGESKGLTRARFYANYAEAILHNNNLADLCLQLVDKAVALISKATMDEKDTSHIVYIISLKIYRKYKDTRDNEAMRKSLIHEARNVTACCRDPGFFLELSKMADNREDAIKLLKEGQKCIREPGHILLELLLLEYQSDDWNQERTEQEYSSLRETFSSYRKNLCLIDFNRGHYLLIKRDVKRAIEFCASAYEQDPLLNLVPGCKQEAFFCELRKLVADTNKYQEYLAWYADNIGSFGQELNIESLYKESMSTCVCKQFVQEYLGRYYLKRREFELAAESFRQLSAHHEGRRELLAESLLYNPARTMRMLEECLESGCKDAAMEILTVLEERKARDNTWQQIRNRATKRVEQDSTQDPLYFDKAVYEICAKIKITLQDSNSYFLDRKLNDNSKAESAQTKIVQLLELNGLTSLRQQSNDGHLEAEERGSLMRSNRLEMTVLHLQNMPNSQVQLNNQIISVMKESKEILDRSLAALFHKCSRAFAYVHAFNKMKNAFDAKHKKLMNESKSGAERQKLEMNLLIELLKNKPELGSTSSVAGFLQTAVAKLDKNFHQNAETRDLFSFMVNREHRILSGEDGWIIRWIYLVNNEKHGSEILVKELNEQLRSDWSGDGECKRTAYDVAHSAAEFAEETWVAFSEKSNQKDSFNEL